MQAVHRSSSRPAVVLALLGVLALAGCSGQPRKVSGLTSPPSGTVQVEPAQDSTVPETKTSATQAGKAENEAIAEPASQVHISGAKSAATDEGPGKRMETASGRSATIATPGTSAWCRYIDARAEAKNALLLSPTVSASVDDDEQTTAKISYDIVDIARARLEKQSAQAKCQRYDAAGRIARMVFVTPQSLTYAGNLAKANYLNSRRDTLQRLAREIDAHVRKGDMTAQLASGLKQHIETVRSIEFHARSEAYRRQTVGLLDAGEVRGLDEQLTGAERTLQQVDRMSRTLDAISVNVTAGVNRDSRDDNELFDDQAAYAKLSVSYRIGALSPRRARYERIAEEARVEALHEYSHGSLWRTAEMAAAIVRARHGLEIQRDRVKAAIKEARANASKFARGYEIQLYQTKYRAQVDVIKLTGELKGIEATIADMHKVEQNLRFQ